MTYTIKPTSRFQKDIKRIKRKGYDVSLLTDVIKKLANRSNYRKRIEITV